MSSAYFESCWAILSSICIVNLLFGLLVTNITSVSLVSSIPVITSAAGAVANGACYYAFYTDYPDLNKAVASVFADSMWLIQEAGVTLYGFAVIRRNLQGGEAFIFQAVFWFLILTIAALRAAIATQRARFILDPELGLQDLINRLHIGYFTAIALVECVTSYFLLKKFASGKKASEQVSLGASLFSHLMHSTEIRLATLALIGTTRAVTYYFQAEQQRATSDASQVDRFVYTVECMFPVMLYIDMLASRIIHTNKSSQNMGLQFRRQTLHSRHGGTRSPAEDSIHLFRVPSRHETVKSTGTIPTINAEHIERPRDTKFRYSAINDDHVKQSPRVDVFRENDIC